jgi:hypothetical protein
LRPVEKSSGLFSFRFQSAAPIKYNPVASTRLYPKVNDSPGELIHHDVLLRQGYMTKLRRAW